MNPFGVAWPLLKASDLIRVNSKGEVVEGGPVRLLNNAGEYIALPRHLRPRPTQPNLLCIAYMIHHAVHEARPEINCVAHSHSVHGRAFSTLGRSIDIITQDSCAFYNDLAFYNSFGGIVLGAEEGVRIAGALGNKKAAILANHGLLTAGKSIESTVFWFMSLETCCRVQLLADAAAAGRGGKVVKIEDEEAAYTYKAVGSELAGWFSAQPTFKLMELESGEDYTS